MQTNEDNLEVETQTDGIELTDKWTQFPVRCRTNLKTEEDLIRFNVVILFVIKNEYRAQLFFTQK